MSTVLAVAAAPLVLLACAVSLLTIAACIGGTQARRQAGIDYEADAMRAKADRQEVPHGH